MPLKAKIGEEYLEISQEKSCIIPVNTEETIILEEDNNFLLKEINENQAIFQEEELSLFNDGSSFIPIFNNNNRVICLYEETIYPIAEKNTTILQNKNYDLFINNEEDNFIFEHDIMGYVDKVQVEIDHSWRDIKSLYEISDDEKIYHFPTYSITLNFKNKDTLEEENVNVTITINNETYYYNDISSVMLGRFPNGTYEIYYKFSEAIVGDTISVVVSNKEKEVNILHKLYDIIETFSGGQLNELVPGIYNPEFDIDSYITFIEDEKFVDGYGANISNYMELTLSSLSTGTYLAVAGIHIGILDHDDTYLHCKGTYINNYSSYYGLYFNATEFFMEQWALGYIDSSDSHRYFGFNFLAETCKYDYIYIKKMESNFTTLVEEIPCSTLSGWKVDSTRIMPWIEDDAIYFKVKHGDVASISRNFDNSEDTVLVVDSHSSDYYYSAVKYYINGVIRYISPGYATLFLPKGSNKVKIEVTFDALEPYEEEICIQYMTIYK